VNRPVKSGGESRNARGTSETDFMADMMGVPSPSVGVAGPVPAAAAVLAPTAATAGGDGLTAADSAGGDGAASTLKRGRDGDQDSAPSTPSKTTRRTAT
jgi:hypothetical protein